MDEYDAYYTTQETGGWGNLINDSYDIFKHGLTGYVEKVVGGETDPVLNTAKAPTETNGANDPVVVQGRPAPMQVGGISLSGKNLLIAGAGVAAVVIIARAVL